VSASFWAVIGLLLVLAEFVVPQFVVFFFGLGALLNALLALVIPGLAGRLPLQLLIWAATSSVSLALLRRYGAPWFRGENRRPGDDAEDGAGATAEVIEGITPERPGRIRFRGTTWQARTFDETIPVGATVTILQKESLTYIVTAGDLLGATSVDDEPPRYASPEADDSRRPGDPSYPHDQSRPDHRKEDS
jgi:membrane protein implicated in regulation of membrane protease activity